jgi:hypothetical protein
LAVNQADIIVAAFPFQQCAQENFTAGTFGKLAAYFQMG